MSDLVLITLVIFLTTLVEGNDQSTNPKPRIINKSSHKRPEIPITAQTGEIVYEDESEYQSDQMEGMHEPYYPPATPVEHMPYETVGYGSLSKRYGQSMFGDDFALFLVLLTIAGFFGLIISMLMPFTFLLSNGGVIPLGLGGINGINGINGLGVNGLGGGLGLGLGGLGGGVIGRKRRSEIYLKRKLMEVLSSVHSALDKYRTYS